MYFAKLVNSCEIEKETKKKCGKFFMFIEIKVLIMKALRCMRIIIKVE